MKQYFKRRFYMKKDYTHISFVLDRSGSMESVKSDTIGGFNSFLKDQQKESGACSLSMIQFDNEYEELHNFKAVKDVAELTDKVYVPRAMTALLDAMGRMIVSTGNALEKIKEEDRPEKVIFVVLTDGMENASKEFTHAKVMEMIKHQEEKYAWKFIYLGANQDAIQVGATMGFAAGNSMSFAANCAGVTSSYVSVSNNIKSMRKMKREDYVTNDSFFSDEDRKKQEEAGKVQSK
jgi:Mg-chelatase subunit ChlD